MMQCQCLEKVALHPDGCKNEATLIAYNLAVKPNPPCRTTFLCDECIRPPWMRIKRLK